MKIEKISENQIKFILSKADLIERNMKLAELSYGSEKTQELFREMMEQAMLECDFHTESNTPLIIEAIPVSQESLMIIVTKTSASEDIESRFNLISSRTKDLRKQRPKFDEDPDIEADGTAAHVFVFKSLDEIADAAARIEGQFEGESSVYKKDKKYYLVLNSGASADLQNKESLEMLLLEYAQKISSSPMSRIYLEEHGDVIIAYDAIKNLAEYMT